MTTAISLRWPITMLLMTGIIAVTTMRACDTVEARVNTASTTIDRIETAASNIAERFRSGRITKTFIESVPELLPDEGGRLEVAAFEVTETFELRDERRVLFDAIDLGTNEVEIRVPATYRYFVPLGEGWTLDVDEQTCLVIAPRPQPTLPVAIHTDELRRRSSRGWLRGDVDEQMVALERSITPTLDARAGQARHLELVREPSRRVIASFVRTWLLAEDHWREDRFRRVVVRFEDELDDRLSEGPTLEL